MVKGKGRDRMIKMVCLALVMAVGKDRKITCRFSAAISKAFGTGHERAWPTRHIQPFDIVTIMLLSTKFKLEYHVIVLSKNR